jgi:ornithine cyclodeaminase/alanine dehydrogenase-like protein (mu-crystallin family)
VPLYLTEADVDGLLGPADAVAAVEASFRRAAAGVTELLPRARLPLAGGKLNVMAAVDRELGLAAIKTYTSFDNARAAEVVLLSTERAEVVAVLAAQRLGQLRTGAASAVAARLLARPGARTLGVIGCGVQARSQVECIREALPELAETVVYCRDPERREAFAAAVGACPAGYGREAAEQDVVVTITSSRDPVLRGDWLRPGAAVIAAGANRPEARELDNGVIVRASFVCCDSAEQARLEASDLAEPARQGVLDWLEVHELSAVVAGEVVPRQRDGDIVLFKSLGIALEDLAVAALAVERARERGVGTQLPA